MLHRTFEAAQTQSQPWTILMRPWLPAMQWLREDTRYSQAMVACGRLEYWGNHGQPRGCQSVDGPDGRHLSCPEHP